MKQLEPLVGTWDVHMSFPELGEANAVARFEWILGGAFLLMADETDMPEVPDSHVIIGADGDQFLQYYFDSRGVVRQYHMTFTGTDWKIWRDREPGGFAQRFAATLGDDGVWRGAFEREENGAMIHDFDISYRRRGDLG